MHKRYLLGVLLLIFAFNSVDGQALGLLMQDIKADLALSDTELGLLSGIAFAFFYSVMGVPIARWADTGNRIAVISITTALWSVAVMLCGVAGSFAQLLLIRAGVAVGEAGCVPPAQSLIADCFGRGERPRAVAIYMLGPPLSVVVGYFLAGWLGQFYGWRATFAVLGFPGILLAALAWLTLRDPRTKAARAGRAPAHEPEADAPSLRRVMSTLCANATFRHLLASSAVVYFFGTGIGQWQPAFLIRSYGLKTGELGSWFALVYGAGGLLGTYLGGEWASRKASGNERLQLRAMAIMYAAMAGVWSLTYLTHSKYVAFGMIGVASISVTLTSGPLFAAIQSVVPERMRAMSVAVIYLFSNLVGAGLGPLAVGALSDALQPMLHQDALRYALVLMCPGYLWCGWHLWRAGATAAADIAAADR